MKPTKLIILALILALCGAITCYAEELPCDCPTCAFTAFKSTQDDTYNATLELADEYNLDEYILFAIMYRESRFHPDAINYNSNGSVDRGICQINSVHDSWIAYRGLDVWTDNIECACILLSDLMENYTEREAIAGYGVGCSGMLNGGGFDKADELYLIIDELKNI